MSIYVDAVYSYLVNRNNGRIPVFLSALMIFVVHHNETVLRGELFSIDSLTEQAQALLVLSDWRLPKVAMETKQYVLYSCIVLSGNLVVGASVADNMTAGPAVLVRMIFLGEVFVTHHAAGNIVARRKVITIGAVVSNDEVVDARRSGVANQGEQFALTSSFKVRISDLPVRSPN